MSKHPIDHDRTRDDGKVAKEYSRIERESAEDISDPKVRAMTKAAHKSEDGSLGSRMKAFLKIDREKSDS